MEKEDNTLNVASIIVQILMNVLFYGIAIYLTVNFANRAYDFAYQVYGPVTMAEAPGESKKVEIKEGTSSVQIANMLYNNKLIVDKYSFLVRLKLSELNICPKTYTLSTSMTYSDIIDKICENSSEDKDNS